ncbi:MAG TPA: DUF4156 domain-containing protein [Mariprofundaceae bacterium]|nr:DUF4156 domain-containing protein [Mariprofundaceae bacterium]
MRNTVWMAAACALAMAASACTFVKPDAQGQTVRIATAGEVAGCTKIGRTAVTVPYKLGFIPRSEKSVVSDLQAMAKNSAADMHGDTIVVTSPPRDGNQSFDVYRCRQ